MDRQEHEEDYGIGIHYRHRLTKINSGEAFDLMLVQKKFRFAGGREELYEIRFNFHR